MKKLIAMNIAEEHPKAIALHEEHKKGAIVIGGERHLKMQAAKELSYINKNGQKIVMNIAENESLRKQDPREMKAIVVGDEKHKKIQDLMKKINKI